jgi:uncharacterized protein
MKKLITITLYAMVAMTAYGCANLNKTSYLTTRQVIDALQLEPMNDEACPGYYLPTYESRTKAGVSKDRSAASLIYYMMTPEVTLDPWHIITSDEIMLYHAGAPMIQMLLYPDGSWAEIVLGPEVDKGHVMQQVIPAGTWMGFVKKEDANYNWGLYGVMVVPGWHIEDIRMVTEGPEFKDLMKRYPGAVSRGKALGLF